MFRILGLDNSVHACDCCGKSHLKNTVLVDIDGTLYNYGSVCATKHTGLSDREIKEAIRDDSDGRKKAAQKEYDKSPEAIALSVKQTQARRDGLVGVDFRNACDQEIKAARLLADKLSEKFGVQLYI